MNATELVAALRAEHYLLEAMWGCSDPQCCGVYDEEHCATCGTPWPCLPSLAADRIEKALAFAAFMRSLDEGNTDGR